MIFYYLVENFSLELVLIRYMYYFIVEVFYFWFVVLGGEDWGDVFFFVLKVLKEIREFKWIL